MKERSVTHATFVIERSYPAKPERVFAAFSDPSQKCRWFTSDKEFRPETFAMDFRVGGRERSRFQTQGVTCTNDTVYLDIVPNRRIVIAYTMTLGDHRISSSHATTELLPIPKGTDLLHGTSGLLRRGRWRANPRRGLAQAARQSGKGSGSLIRPPSEALMNKGTHA